MTFINKYTVHVSKQGGAVSMMLGLCMASVALLHRAPFAQAAGGMAADADGAAAAECTWEAVACSCSEAAMSLMVAPQVFPLTHSLLLLQMLVRGAKDGLNAHAVAAA